MPSRKAKELTYASIFTGIGGFDIPAQELGMVPQFICEIDDYALATLDANAVDGMAKKCDIYDVKKIPEHDVMLAGFPCPDFSIAGKQMGFKGDKGKLFFELHRVLNDSKPRAFLFENVKMRKDYQDRITQMLGESGYTVYNQTLNSKDFGVPQNRVRNYWVGFRNDLNVDDFAFPDATDSSKRLKDILEPNESVDEKYCMRYIESLRKREARHVKKGSGFRYPVRTPDSIAGTITGGEKHHSGSGLESNLVVDQRCPAGLRRMTPREWARLQGFPDSFEFPVSDSQAYRLLGNAVTVPVVKEILKNVKKKLD